MVDIYRMALKLRISWEPVFLLPCYLGVFGTYGNMVKGNCVFLHTRTTSTIVQDKIQYMFYSGAIT